MIFTNNVNIGSSLIFYTSPKGTRTCGPALHYLTGRVLPRLCVLVTCNVGWREKESRVFSSKYPVLYLGIVASLGELDQGLLLDVQASDSTASMLSDG